MTIFSSSWYRVAGLRPQLRRHAFIHRHQYRGQIWYVLQDRASDRFHRFSPTAYFLIGLMDGQRTVEGIWEAAIERLGDDAPTQDEVIQLLGQLHLTDVLQCDLPPDTAELFRRQQRLRRRRWQTQVMSVLAWRIPLVDPDQILQRLRPMARAVFSRGGLGFWLVLVASGGILAATHWTDLTKDVVDRVLAPSNLLLLWLTFPIVKILHEWGHALAVTRFGQEVHDMGLMLLVVTPVPYVDASGASALESKWQRAVVGAAGMMVELGLASVALWMWTTVEPGIVRAVAYNVILIAGISTLIFNGNPLLRYDGYYILADLLELPNLKARATAYGGYLVNRYGFGLRSTEPPPTSPSERAWFVGYAVASSIYRVIVIFLIALFLAAKFFVLGVLFALFGLATLVMWPMGKTLTMVVRGPRLREVRRRAVIVTVACVVIGFAALCVLPVPLRSHSEGVVWIPDEAFVRAETGGFIDRVVATPGGQVHRGDVLIEARDPELSAQADGLAAQLRELRARYDDQRRLDRVKAQILQEEAAYVEQRLARVQSRLRSLVIRANADGVFVLPRSDDLLGRWVKQGEVLAHIVDISVLRVRTVVSQGTIALVRHRVRGVAVRLADRLSDVRAAIVAREVPAASAILPSPALGTSGGGSIAIDPGDSLGTKALQTMFQVDLEVQGPPRPIYLGEHVYVRFDHGWEPLAVQGYRHLRQLFLARFSV
jgi:putative peptide zinc metalloprotease protein